MGATLGKLCPDADANPHLGIIAIPIPTLKGDPELLNQLREKLHRREYDQLSVVDFSAVAQSCHTYDALTEKMAGVAADLRHFGIGILGDRKNVNQLTGRPPLLR